MLFWIEGGQDSRTQRDPHTIRPQIEPMTFLLCVVIYLLSQVIITLKNSSK